MFLPHPPLIVLAFSLPASLLVRASRRGGANGAVSDQDLSFFVCPFLSFLGLSGFSGIFPIFAGFPDFSRFVDHFVSAARLQNETAPENILL